MSEISPKQLEANRQNAKLGGVKTDKGKAISKYNALKHGILSEGILLKGENESKLLELGRKLRSELKPKCELEMILVERIITNTWRLKRAMKAEREMMEDDMKLEKTLGSAFGTDFARADSYGKFTRYETCLERGIYKALHELQRMQSARNGEKPPAPIAIDVDVTQDK